MSNVDLLSREQIVAKGEYASLKGVSAARVSQWIAEGKLTAPALVGEGRAARVDVALADAQLRTRLDPAQRLGNGIATRLDEPAPPSSPSGPKDPIVDPIHEQLRLEKLEQIRRANRRQADEEAERRGLYVDARHVRIEMGKIAERMIRMFEGSLVDFSQAIAGRFQIPQRDALHLLRTEFAAYRGKASAVVLAEAGAAPEFRDAGED